MATLREFGLLPEEPESTPPRRRRYVIHDESGARPLPRDEYGDEVYAADPLDEEVELPGVSRAPAGLLFGIGVGLGVAAIAVVGGLYLGGYVGRPVLGTSPEPTPLAENLATFDEWANVEALERARIAPVWIAEASVRPTGTEVESPDIQVIDQSTSAAPVMAPKNPSAASPEVSGEELEGAQPASSDADPTRLSNELEELQQSLRPRGPQAPPKERSNDQSAPAEPETPPPAAPTAPAETIPPGSQSPY